MHYYSTIYGYVPISSWDDSFVTPVLWLRYWEGLFAHTWFEQVCSTLADQTCPTEIIRLNLFPFTLKEKAKAWLLTLRSNSISTWNALHEAFIKKFFPNRLTTDVLRQIKMFTQKEGENFAQVWERFKDLLLVCPHHGFEKWHTVSFFYNGLKPRNEEVGWNYVLWWISGQEWRRG